MTWKIQIQQDRDRWVECKAISRAPELDKAGKVVGFFRLKHPMLKVILLHVQSGKTVNVTFSNGTYTITNPEREVHQYLNLGKNRKVIDRLSPKKKVKGDQHKFYSREVATTYLCERFGLYNGTVIMRNFHPVNWSYGELSNIDG